MISIYNKKQEVDYGTSRFNYRIPRIRKNGTLTVVDPHISKNVDYNVIFLSNFPVFNVV